MRSVLSLSLPKKVAADVDEFAKNTGRNKSDIVKESLAIYLWEAPFQKVRRRLGAKAKKAGIAIEEDVFRVIS
jgi:metal-responsive CopG/Arc/MetJ family transcriptional regulator